MSRHLSLVQWYNSKEGHHITHLAEVAEEKRLAALKAAK